MGLCSEEIKQGKKERKKTDKERLKLPEGRRKEGYCACALRGCMMKLLFCVVCSDGGSQGEGEQRRGEINGKLPALRRPIVQYGRPILKKPLPR